VFVIEEGHDDYYLCWKLRYFIQEQKGFRKFGWRFAKFGLQIDSRGKFYKFERTDTSITTTQVGLINHIAKATGMVDSNRNHTPTTQEALGSDPDGPTMWSDPDGPTMKETWNRQSIIGMMLYLSTNTRSDIAFAVSQGACFNNDPTQSYVTTVKTIIRYLIGTKEKGTIIMLTEQCSIAHRIYFAPWLVSFDVEVSSANGDFAQCTWSGIFGTAVVDSSVDTNPRTVVRSVKYHPTPSRIDHCNLLLYLWRQSRSCYFGYYTTHHLSRTKYFHVKFHHFWYYIKMEEGKNRKIHMVKCSTEEQGADLLTKGQPRVILQINRLIIISTSYATFCLCLWWNAQPWFRSMSQISFHWTGEKYLRNLNFLTGR
jgi:hypothetical protein